MRNSVIAGILSLLNDELGRLSDGDWDANKDNIRTVLRAYHAVGHIRAEDVDHVRLDCFNNSGGALSWCGRSFALHPDRCECQGNDPIPHRHYDHAPFKCARCMKCKGYAPVKKEDHAPSSG